MTEPKVHAASRRAWLGALLALGAACGPAAPCPDTAATPPGAPPGGDFEPPPHGEPGSATPADADAFVRDVNDELRKLVIDAERMNWVKSTYITDDTELLDAKQQERVMEFRARKIKEARAFEGLELAPDTKRSLYLLKFSAGLPAPADPKKRAELAETASKMEGIYGKGKYCSPILKGKGTDKTSECLPLVDLSKILAESRDYDLQLEAWRGWHSIAVPIRPLYQRYVELGNEGAKDLGFSDMGEIWKGRYDMSAEDFTKEMDRLWEQVRPLYEKLHCYARGKLRQKYGEAKIGKRAPIPAHLLGNMWAQEWSNLYPMMEPYAGKSLPDLGKRLQEKKYDARAMVRLGEKFFVSLGMQALPNTFWERSLFLKPADRDVECHASAWHIDRQSDVRIKMCIQVNQVDLVTIHHELGHDYYYLQYRDLSTLFQDGANDGFHEGIGDTLALSVTPEYLAKIGLYDRAPDSKEAELNVLMRRALEAIAFLPFGKLIDQWRWDVFAGKTPPGKYDEAWWALRRKFQGVAPAVERSEADFDPGAKYHIPANVPYTRYFIARLLQYQFHRALCKVAGYTGPLYKCSIYDNKAAGQKLAEMLKLGASKPWPDALAALSGERQMDATAIIDYYAPLMSWLDEQNKGEQCGWE